MIPLRSAGAEKPIVSAESLRWVMGLLCALLGWWRFRRGDLP